MEDKLKVKGIELTVREWLNLLEDDIHIEAMDEFRKQGKTYRLSDKCNSLRDAIDKFTWENSIKGHEFWSKLSNDINLGKQDRLNKTISQLFD